MAHPVWELLLFRNCFQGKFLKASEIASEELSLDVILWMGEQSLLPLVHPVAVVDGLSEIVFGGMLMQKIPGRKGVIPLVVPMVEPMPVVAADDR